MAGKKSLEEALTRYSVLSEGDDDDLRHEEAAKDEAEKGDFDVENLALDERKAVLREAAKAEKEFEAASDPLASRRYGKQFGPKGVQADAEYAAFLEMKEREREAMRRADLHRAPSSLAGASLDGFSGSMSLAAQEAARRSTTARKLRGDGDSEEEEEEEEGAGRGRARGGGRGAGASSAGGASAPTAAVAASPAAKEEEEDDDFFARYRLERLRLLKAAAGLPEYGAVTVLRSSEQFVEAVDAVDARSLCVVLVHETFLPAARAVLAQLPALALALPRTKFMAMEAAVGSKHLDALGLPALIIYRGGEVVDTAVRISDDVGPRPSVDDLVAFLNTKGVSV